MYVYRALLLECPFLKGPFPCVEADPGLLYCLMVDFPLTVEVTREGCVWISFFVRLGSKMFDLQKVNENIEVKNERNSSSRW